MNIYLCSLTLGFFLVSLLWSKTCFLFKNFINDFMCLGVLPGCASGTLCMPDA